MEEKAKTTLDWFVNKTAFKQVLILLLLIIAYLGWNFHVGLQSTVKELNALRQQAVVQDSIIHVLESNLQKAKFDNILSNSNADKNPIPIWFVDKHTSVILWCNKAYEKKYLTTKFTNREEFIGTDGSYVFGIKMVEKFKANNNLVFINQRPMTFRNEVNSIITKFPIRIGDYIYAIGGIEYIMFE